MFYPARTAGDTASASLPASASPPSKALSSPTGTSVFSCCKMTLLSGRPVAGQLYVGFGVLHGRVWVWTDAPQRLPATPLVPLCALWHWRGISNTVGWGSRGESAGFGNTHSWWWAGPSPRAAAEGFWKSTGLRGVMKFSLLLLVTPHPSAMGYPMVHRVEALY